MSVTVSSGTLGSVIIWRGDRPASIWATVINKLTCVCETRMPPAATKSKYGQISKSQILTPPRPQGHVMSVKCEQPLYELTVQVWLLYDHPNFKYCTLFISGTELRTDRRTDGRTDRQTDDPNTRCPRRTFQAGGIKMIRVVRRQRRSPGGNNHLIEAMVKVFQK